MSRNASHVDVFFWGRLSLSLKMKSSDRAAGRRTRVHVSWPKKPRIHTDKSTIFCAYLHDVGADFSNRARMFSSDRRFLLFQDDTPIESVAERLTTLAVHSPRRLHVAQLDIDSERSFIRRFLTTLEQADDHPAIIDAWWDGDDLVALSPDFERLRVSAEKLPRLASLTQTERADFEIDPHGAFLHWPDLDLHLGWNQLKQCVDPAALVRAQQRSEQFNVRYGQAIRALREEHGLRQSDIPGLDERSIRRIEGGKVRATTNALSRLARAHHLDENAYLNALADRLA